MTRIAKLHARMLGGGALSFAELQRMLNSFGFELDRVRGSHHIYRHPTIADRINIQPHGKTAKPYQVAQFVAIIRSNGLLQNGTEE